MSFSIAFDKEKNLAIFLSDELLYEKYLKKSTIKREEKVLNNECVVFTTHF